MKDAPLLHALEFGLIQSLRGLVRALPHTRARPMGRAIGRVAHRLMPARRRLALDNLERALPELDAGERQAIVRASFEGMSSQAAEMFSWDRFDARSLCRRITLEGWEHVQEAATSSGSVFLMTAHLGPWELLGAVASLYLPPASALVRPLDNPHLEAFLSKVRTRHGLTLIPKHGAARRLVRSLQEGGRVLVLIDQRVRPRDAIEVPFFGRPARTSTLIARLALKHKTPIVPIYALPEAGGRYRIVARKAIPAHDLGPDAVAELTTRCTHAVEREIRLRPDLWLWVHDRWRLA